MSNLKNQLAALKKNWEGGKQEQKRMFGAENLPDGVYEALLVSAQIKEINAKLFIERKFVLQGGEQEGVQLQDLMFLESEMGCAFANRWIDMHGYASPNDPAELPEFLEAIQAEKPICKVKTKKNDEGRININVMEVIGTSAGAEAPASVEATAEAPAAETAVELSPEEQALRERLLTFATSQGLTIDPEQDDNAKIVEVISGFAFKEEEEVNAEEMALLKEIGLEANITLKPKPAPVMKPALPKVGTPAKAVPAPAAKVLPKKK